MSDVYDLVVIGAGPAGQVAAELAAAFGRRALMVERNQPGGVVTTTGGAPTKALREAALYLTGFRQQEVYGARAAAALDVVLPTLRARIERVRDLLQGAVARQLAERRVTYLQGTARLSQDHSVCVTSPEGATHQIAARTILIATGSRPTHPPGIPFDDPDIYDSDQIYSLSRVPEDIVIIGGGAVGVEFATIFTALGIPATLVSQSDRLLPSMDGELVGLMAEEFERRGVRLILGAGANTVARVAGRLSVTLSTGAVLDTDAVLFAAGRTPNTEGLGLEQAGVQLDAHGRIAVDRYYRTTAAGIYAAGDVVSPARASTARQQVRATGLPYVVGRCDLARTARGAIAGQGGRLKLLFRADDRKLLGVHCLGDIASEVVGLGHMVLHIGGSVEVFLTLALNTPTYTSAYHDAVVDGLSRLAELLGHSLGTAARQPVTTGAVADAGRP
jgi:NAD(P) transhydrogenase